MTHSHKFLLAALIASFVLFSGTAHAQQNSAPDAETAALREKAFKLLESVAGQINALQSTENRARIGANLVESLWKHDEERARSLLRMVQEDLRAELQKHGEQLQDHARFRVFFKLRHDTVERIAKHDAELALQFLAQTHPSHDVTTRHYDFMQSEEALQLRLAKEVAANNPDVALKLGRQALDRRLSSDLVFVLRKLNRKHRQHAQILFKEMVEKLRNTEFTDDWNNRSFAEVLVRGFQPPDAEESVYRDLIGIFVTSALANGCVNKLPEEDARAHVCRSIAAGIRQMEKFDHRVVRFKHWMADSYEPRTSRLAYDEMEEVIEEGSLDQLHTLASKYPDQQELIYLRAYDRARRGRDFEQARNIAMRYFVNVEKQKELIALLENDQKKASIDEEKFAEIQKRLDGISDTSGRVRFLLSQANEFGVADRKAALKLLDQAGEVIETMKTGKEQTQFRLGLALMYCRAKNDRGFAIMESLVPRLNELVETAAKLDGYDTRYLRDGEWNMSANGPIGEILTHLAQQAGYFAWFDFDRAVSLAAQFERPEIRMMAHLKLAQGILAGPPNRFARY